MAQLDDDFEFVTASVERTVRQQRAACETVAEDSSASSRGLARHLLLAYRAIERQIQKRRGRYQEALDNPMRQDIIVEMRQLLWDVRELQSNLEWLASAQQSPLDLGTKYFVEEIARGIVAPRVELTVVSGGSPSYATSSNPWEPLINDWGEGVPSNEPIVVVVFLPRREEATGLLHPLIVHELGHAADERMGLVDKIWAKAQKRKRLSKRFAAAVNELKETKELDTETARGHVAERLRSWIAEALCDSIAVHHLGPSYLYAFLAEVGAGNMDQPGAKHPSPRQRIRHMRTDLVDLKWLSFVRKADPALERWVATQCEQRMSYSGLAEFLTWAIDELQPGIRQVVQGLLRKRVFLPDGQHLSEVEELLGAGIPPAQRRSREPVSREAILLACWHAAMKENGGGPGALPGAVDTSQLLELLPAALELCALAHAWKEVR
jgi:hypothetical protein